MKIGFKHRARWLPRALGVLLVLAAFAAPVSRSVPVAAVGRTDEAPLDLAAMVLTPSDLEAEGLDGYAVADGDTLLPEMVAAAFAFQRGLPDDEAEELFAETGLVRAYKLGLDLPAGPGGAVARSVIVTIHEYADEDGAADAFAVLTDGDSDELAGEDGDDPAIGDEASLARRRGAIAEPYHALDLTFRVGRLTAVVRLVDFEGDEPAVADAERLASRLLERIEEPEAGLDALNLRLGGDGVIPIRDLYTLQDGEVRRASRESAEDAAAAEAESADAGMTDEYFVGQQISTTGVRETDTYVYGFVQRFADEGAASVYLRGALERAADDDQFEAPEEIDGLTEYGDEAIAFSQVLHWEANDVDLIYQSYYLRVDDSLAMIRLISPDTDGVRPSLAVLEELAASQAACLDDGGCLDPAPLPDELQAMVEAGREGGTVRPARNAVEAIGLFRPDDGTYVGPTFGVEVTYDTAAWDLLVEDTVDGRDIAFFFEDDAPTTLALMAHAATESADECLDRETVRLPYLEAYGAARPVLDEDGDPVAGGNAQRAYAAYGLAIDDGTRTFMYMECRSFAGGEATLFISHAGPLDHYDASSAAREALLAGLELPGE